MVLALSLARTSSRGHLPLVLQEAKELTNLLDIVDDDSAKVHKAAHAVVVVEEDAEVVDVSAAHKD